MIPSGISTSKPAVSLWAARRGHLHQKGSSCGDGLLTLACPSRPAPCITSAVVTWLLSHFVKCTRAGGCRTGSALRRCFPARFSTSERGLPGALGLQAAGSVSARQAVAVAFYFLILCPAWPLVAEGFSQRMWGVVRRLTKRKACHCNKWPWNYFSGYRNQEYGKLRTAEQPLAYHQHFSFGTELGPRAADAELPEAADLYHQ